MILIQFDSQQLVQDLLLTNQQVQDLMDYTVKEITANFKERWEANAARELGSSRVQYIASLNVMDEGFARGAVVLTGQLPNMVEAGVSEFDLKDGLLAGPNAKVSRSGALYNTVPFSFGTPGALPENFSTIMPKEIYALVKRKPVGRPLVKEELPKQFQEPAKSKVRQESSRFKQYTHKSSIFEGLEKRKDATTGQHTYGSFRRVSDNSDPNSWVHPGIQQHDLAGKTLREFDVPTETGRAIDSYMRSIGRG